MDLEQAAVFDGVDRFQIFRTIALPLAESAIRTVAIFVIARARPRRRARAAENARENAPVVRRR